MVGVRKARLELDRAARGIDGVVDENELALAQQRVGLAFVGVDHQRLRAGLHGAVDAAEGIVGQREYHVDRVDLPDHHQTAGIGGMHDIARVDQARAHAARERRRDGGEVELHARERDLRVVGAHRGLELRDGGALCVERLLRGGVVLDQALEAREVELCIGEAGFVAGLGRLRLLQLRLERARVDAREHLAGLDVLALDKAHAFQLPVDARRDRDGLHGLHGADADQTDVDILRLRPRDGHAHGRHRRLGGGRRRQTRKTEREREQDDNGDARNQPLVGPGSGRHGD